MARKVIFVIEAGQVSEEEGSRDTFGPDWVDAANIDYYVCAKGLVAPRQVFSACE
eukprot:EST42942.1 Hypothetical protein SS50377_17389 [Spironucleus salmonicida]